MTTLTATLLSDTHPMLPTNWRRSMHQIKAHGGPWPCTSCNGPSYLSYRCSQCGANLCGSGGSSGRYGGDR